MRYALHTRRSTRCSPYGYASSHIVHSVSASCNARSRLKHAPLSPLLPPRTCCWAAASATPLEARTELHAAAHMIYAATQTHCSGPPICLAAHSTTPAYDSPTPERRRSCPRPNRPLPHPHSTHTICRRATRPIPRDALSASAAPTDPCHSPTHTVCQKDDQTNTVSRVRRPCPAQAVEQQLHHHDLQPAAARRPRPRVCPYSAPAPHTLFSSICTAMSSRPLPHRFTSPPAPARCTAS